MTEEDLDDTKVGFGKYAERTPNEIAETDPGYILWLAEKIVPAVVSRALVELCEQDMRDSEEEQPRW